MKKNKVFSIVMALILMTGLLPVVGYAASDDFTGMGLQGERDSLNDFYLLKSVTFQFKNEKTELLYSDITGISITKDGQPFPVEFDVPPNGKLRGFSITYSDGSDAGMMFELFFKNPITDEGVYQFSCTINGKAEQSWPAEIIINSQEARDEAQKEADSFSGLISNEAELRAFADAVNDGNNFGGKYFRLTQDIELTGEWAPIGGVTWGNEFHGTFDGDGYTITGVRIGSAAAPSQLERICFISGGVVKNLTVDIEIYARGGADRGQNVSVFGDSSVDKCVVTGTIIADRSSKVSGVGDGWRILNSRCSAIIIATGVGIIGGIRADLPGYNDSLIQNCVFDGKIDASRGDSYGMGGGSTVGGIVGTMTYGSVITGCRSLGDITCHGVAGGIAGSISLNYYWDKVSSNYGNYIEDCYVSGNMTGTTAGGLIGQIDWVSETPFDIRNCHVSGDVSGISGYSGNIGGFIGFCTIYKGSINNCYATGDVTGDVCGGFIAVLASGRYDSRFENGSLTQSWNDPYIPGDLTVSRCFASGNVTAAGGTAGGFVSGGRDAEITECAAFGDVLSDKDAYGFGKHDSSVPSGYSSDWGIGTLERSFAAGNVVSTGANSTAYAFSDSGANNCYAAGNATGETAKAFGYSKNCYYSGKLTSGEKSTAFPEDGYYGTCENIYGDMTVCPDAYLIVASYGKTTTEMQSPAFVDLLNAGQTSRPWKHNEDGYPLLASFYMNDIAVMDAAGGMFAASTGVAAEGHVIVINVAPDDGNKLKTLSVNGNVIDGVSFAMPDADVVVTAEFESASADAGAAMDGNQSSDIPAPDRPNSGGNSGNNGGGGSSGGDSGGGNGSKPFNMAPIYIGGGIVLICLLAALILCIVSRKKGEKEETTTGKKTVTAVLIVLGVVMVAIACIIFLPEILNPADKPPTTDASLAPGLSDTQTPEKSPDSGGAPVTTPKPETPQNDTKPQQEQDEAGQPPKPGETAPTPTTSAPPAPPQPEQIDASGGVYEGGYDADSKRSGYGVWEYNDRNDYVYRYEGHWENGLPHGEGTLYKERFNPEAGGGKEIISGKWYKGFANGEMEMELYASYPYTRDELYRGRINVYYGYVQTSQTLINVTDSGRSYSWSSGGALCAVVYPWNNAAPLAEMIPPRAPGDPPNPISPCAIVRATIEKQLKNLETFSDNFYNTSGFSVNRVIEGAYETYGDLIDKEVVNPDFVKSLIWCFGSSVYNTLGLGPGPGTTALTELDALLQEHGYVLTENNNGFQYEFHLGEQSSRLNTKWSIIAGMLYAGMIAKENGYDASQAADLYLDYLAGVTGSKQPNELAMLDRFLQWYAPLLPQDFVKGYVLY